MITKYSDITIDTKKDIPVKCPVCQRFVNKEDFDIINNICNHCKGRENHDTTSKTSK